MQIKYTNDEVFVCCSNYARHRLKERIIKKQLIKYVCADCGIGSEWNNKKLVLQLEHKNGISNDNRLENLCFLCPNCHSQTETYAGRSSKGMRNADIEPKTNLRTLKRIKDIEKLNQLKNDNEIKFGEYGWKTRFAKKIGISCQKVDKWLMRIDADFLIKCNMHL